MAKRTTRTTTSASNYPTVKMLAFWGVILAGILGFVNLFIEILDWIFEEDNWGWARTLSNVLNILSTVAIFAAIWLAGWDHVKSKGQTWRTLFIIFFIIALLGLLGINVLKIVRGK